MPLISVILPVYNGEQTIGETIKSVLNQTFSDLELIVINDGSQDSTLEVISLIKDPRINVFSYPNAGQAASRNRGLARACGEYIAFIDADDLWTADKLEAQLTALQENPQAAVAYSWSDYINESGQFLRKGSHITINGNAYAKLLLLDFLDNGSNPLIRTQALTEVGIFDVSLTPAEDWDMWLRLASCYEFVAVPSPQILYRVSANSMSANVVRLEAASLQVIERAFAQAPASLQYLKKYSLANLYKYLTFKALEGSPEQHKGLAATRFLFCAIKNDPSLTTHWRVLLKLLFKISALALLPAKQAQALLTKVKTLSNTNTLLNYISVNI